MRISRAKKVFLAFVTASVAVAAISFSVNAILSHSNTKPIELVSARMEPTLLLLGPTINLTVENNGTTPVISLKLVLDMNRNYTFSYVHITMQAPLLPGHYAFSNETLFYAVFSSNASYQVTVTGTLLNGKSFKYVASTYIT